MVSEHTYEDFKKLKGQCSGGTIAVLGAGQSMDKYDVNYFCGEYDCTIGMNFMYKKFICDYVITRHMKVVRDFMINAIGLILLYPPMSADFGGVKLPEQMDGGIVFDWQELAWTRSIAGTAIDFARYLGAGEIHVYGVDFSNEYMKGYRSMPDNEAAEIFALTNKKQTADVIDLIKLKYGVDVKLS